MAIEKAITKENGIVLHYHRIVSVNSVSNHTAIIEVCSYLNRAERVKEATALANGQPMDVYLSTRYIEAPYEPNMGITGAYQYIKTVEPYTDPLDVFEEGNDPVAVAGVVASGEMAIEDVPEEQRAEVEALIPTKPADKEGFLTVARVEPMGYRVFWELVPDPHYDPEAEDGSYSKPFKYVAEMAVEAGFWYWETDKLLPHEAIASGVPESFYDRNFFDYVDEPAADEEPTQPEPVETPVEPETEETPVEPEQTPQEPSEPVVEGGTVIEAEKPVAPSGDYADPIMFEPGMNVELGMFYTDGEDIWECVEAGVAETFTEPWFDVIAV